MNTDARTSNEFVTGGLDGIKKHTRKRRVIITIAVLLLLIIAELIRSNNYIETDEYTYLSSDLPKSFDNVKIVQISDYHNHGGMLDDRLIKKIKEQSPDYIFLTGDIADSVRTDIGKANAFLEKVSKIADCYLVWGNHDYEISDSDREKMKLCCEQNGITVLENDYVKLERGGDSVLLVGTDTILDAGRVQSLMNSLPKERFVMWLHHYPEDFEEIVKQSGEHGAQADLVFCGHAHGGLIRLPFIGGLYAPGQGFLPDYTSGRYNSGDSSMILSRGVGNSGWTLRIFDPFHLPVVTLKSSK